MLTETITAVFQDRDQADRALGRLRAAGTLPHRFTLPGGQAGEATLHLMLRQEDLPLARTILQQTGGRL